ncbi:AAA family ATPase [Enterococcus cecorum]|uniref:AAA family ATPase n=1 Tax=Enterococcus cecorum TaxID=44008 RepID=A0A1Y4QXQ4_9ENTE|nr:ATP-binding protein [Enterococcus cecorum]OUQ10094.1 hypothetical protein B5E88_07815 [Enterococcus cecorum]CAI3250052.1 AAA family ATPase [Enterococcus cecorum]CAI3256969.1 AAA family ATPase [Enterococcus cecorum]CAI3290423.1 AAA family ATPase [Enterococcus cecorum]CAI3309974.1 AAA family ATPase [Enterococcus cecorum]
MKYILLVGVHGVGKTTLVNNLKKQFRITSFAISDLIRQAGNEIKKGDKYTDGIDENQKLWKNCLKQYNFEPEENVILDGHFTLLDKEKQIIELPFSTFDDIDIKAIILKTDLPSVIKKRLLQRDGEVWDINLISAFQNAEIRRTREFALKRSIPLFEFASDAEVSDSIFL